MPNITYDLGGTSFSAVPESLKNVRRLPVSSKATLARGILHTIGVNRESIMLRGKYISPIEKQAIDVLYDACCETGQTTILNDGYTEKEVLISSFETSPIVGKTEGYSFTIELVVL